MKKIIGRVFLLTAGLFFNIDVIADAKLSITDMQGRKIKEACIGVPFILKLYIDKLANDSKEPVISGLDQEGFLVNYQGTSSTIKNISGQVTVERTFSYQVRIDKEGEFIVGPAVIKVQGDIVESNKVKLLVSNCPNKSSSESQASKNSLEISVDKNSFYVGQKIYLTITAKLEEDANISKISQPDLKDFDVYNISGPTKESDEDVTLLKWVYELFPKKEGKFIIPALVGNVQIQDNRHSGLFAGFFNTYDTKQIVSNSLTLDIKKIPANKNYESGDILVGHFTKFKASVGKTTAPVSDGIIYTLSLSGDGNFSKIDFDKLELPEGLRYFKSKSNITRNNDVADEIIDTKVSEFIIQGLVPGEFTIPAQNISFFDPVDDKYDGKYGGKYRSLKTEGIVLTITEASQGSVDTHDIKNGDSNNGDINTNKIDDIIDGDTAEKLGILGFKLFAILTLIPILIWLLVCLSDKTRRTLKYKYLIILLKNRRAQRKLDLKALYKNIIELVAFRYSKNRSEIDYEYLRGIYKDENWYNFLDTLLKTEFGEHKINIQVKKDLFRDSFFWLKKLSR